MAQINHPKNIFTILYQDSSLSWSFVWQSQQNHHCRSWTNRWYMETPEKMETNVRAGHGVTMLPWLILLERFFPKHCGVDSLRREKKGMDEPVTDCIWNMNIINSQCVFLALEDQNWLTAHAKHKFLNLSHTPAKQNGRPCCKYFWTSPINTSFWSLSLENLNFKLVTRTRAATQPVALFVAFVLAHCTNWFIGFSTMGYFITPKNSSSKPPISFPINQPGYFHLYHVLFNCLMVKNWCQSLH